MIWIYLFVLAILFLEVFAAPPQLQNDPKSKYLVDDLPGLHKNVKEEDLPLIFSGHLKLYEENNTHYFFMKYNDQNREAEAENRVIFWLNGGPGCSSMDGAFSEIGPLRLNDKEEVIYNEGSWHKRGSLVFVDQPAGTGFSFTKEYDHDLDQISFEFLKFLEKYYEIFPEDADSEILLAGESYAGQYLPYIAKAILERNNNLGFDDKPYQLSGLLIGNGWVAPAAQSLSYLPYCMQAEVLRQDNPYFARILRQQERCQNQVNQQKSSDENNVIIDECEKILDLILKATLDEKRQCLNMYDHTLRDSYPSCGMNWPPDIKFMTSFFRKEEVMRHLNLEQDIQWSECSNTVSLHFKAKNSLPAIHLLPLVLEEIPVLLFNGNRDIICNYMGTEGFIREMTWNGRKGFPDGASDWLADNDIAGYIKTDRNLTFVNVFDASHMVPFDKPLVSRSLIDIITGNFEQRDMKPNNDGEAKDVIATSSSTKGIKGDEKGNQSEQSSSSGDVNLQASDSKPPVDQDSRPHKITRIIQLIVIIILIWGSYVLYSTYKSRPSSIIKTGASGKKKNVQWADQTEEELDFDKPQESGFFSKLFHKFKGGNIQNVYSPLSINNPQDLEMDNYSSKNDASKDNFLIASDEEDADNNSSNQQGMSDASKETSSH